MASARPVYRPRRCARRTRTRITVIPRNDAFQKERIEVLQDTRRARFVKAFETTGWRNHCHEQLVFSVKAHGDSFLAVSKLDRRPKYVGGVDDIQRKVGEGGSARGPVQRSREEAVITRKVRIAGAKRKPEKYEQATPAWLYNLNDEQHADALLNWFIYGSAAAAGKAKCHALPWDELELGQRYELCRSPLPYLQVGEDKYKTGSTTKCWEILEVEAVLHNNPRSVKDKLLAIAKAISETHDPVVINALLREQKTIAADAAQEAYRFASGRVRRSAALNLHLRRCVEVKDFARGEWKTETIPAYYIIDAGELVLPLAGMNKLSDDFADWFDGVIQYHVDHPEQINLQTARKIYLEGLGPHKSILDHDFDLDACDLRDEVILQRYEQELKRPAHQLTGAQYRKIVKWNRGLNPGMTVNQVLQLRLGKMSFRTQRLFRAARLKHILNQAQPFLWENPNSDLVKFTRLSRYNGCSTVPLSIVEYHPEYLKRLGAWMFGKVAWDPRWPGDLAVRQEDISWVAYLMAEALRRLAHATVLCAYVAAVMRQFTEEPEVPGFQLPVPPTNLFRTTAPHSRGPPASAFPEPY